MAQVLANVREVLAGVERGAWIRFFIALIGLALAFLCAVLSTVFREEGNVWGVAITASAALLVAGVVAFTVVPYLARRVALERVREAFDYDVTREGIVYLVITLVIGVAALNTGNNLLFIVLAAMLSAIIVSGAASAIMLRGLALDVTVPAHVFANREALVRLALKNRRKRLPAFSVSVIPPKAKKAGKVWVLQRSEFNWPPKRRRDEQFVHLPDYLIKLVERPGTEPPIFREPVYFPFVPANITLQTDLTLLFDRRGRYVQEGFGLATKFPFSFLQKTRRVKLAREILVYPSVDETDEFFEVLPMIAGEFEVFVRGRGNDLYRIREHLPGDSARHVDWKATARSGDLKVREFTREDERKLRIVFDNPPPAVVGSEAYERAVALAASLAWHFADGSSDLTFATADYRGGDVHEFLQYLALVQPAQQRSVLDDLRFGDSYNIVLTSRAPGSFPSELWASSYVVYMERSEQANPAS